MFRVNDPLWLTPRLYLRQLVEEATGGRRRGESHHRRLPGCPRPIGREVLAALLGDGEGVLVADIRLALGITRGPARSGNDAAE
jgi:hypothetical protein